MVTTFRQNFRNYLHLISAPIRFYQQCSGTFVKYPELCWPGNLFGSGFSGPGFGVSITIFVIKNTVVRCILVLYECLTYSSNRHFHAYLISHFEFEGLYLKKYTLLRVENAERLFAVSRSIVTVIDNTVIRHILVLSECFHLSRKLSISWKISTLKACISKTVHFWELKIPRVCSPSLVE